MNQAHHDAAETTEPSTAHPLSRRNLLAIAAGGAALSLTPAPARAATRRSTGTGDTAFQSLLRALDARIEAAMRAHAIPGAAVGLLLGDREYVRGYGVTNVEHPTPVDADTLFRVGSTTKTFTGTALMRLVERSRVDLDVPVRRYLPEFTVADRAASRQVTVRQLLNHSSGWLGDDYQDFGRGDNAVARFVDSMTRLPQLTPVGRTFAYNNAGLCVAGRILEVATGRTYEAAVGSLLLDPLDLRHSSFFSDDIIGRNIAAPHNVVNGRAVVEPSFWPQPRSLAPTGGLISSVRDQLAWARFHLGDGTAPNGTRLLSKASLSQMRSRPGPGGTIVVELDGMGITWMLRPTAQGPRIVQHGGTWPGQVSGFLMVPGRGFALTLLTNSVSGSRLRDELFTDDWALRRFAQVSNLPAEPRRLSAAELAPYEGHYLNRRITEAGTWEETHVEFRAHRGRLQGTTTTQGETSELGVVFYRPDFALDLDPTGRPTRTRSDFLRGPDGHVVWWRNHGRLHRHTDQPTP
ncbi:penicillin-binding protein [Streptacidiphilus pinicola]|uniref:Penicillin-binding protein n=1 Tax=Streptacidiphilus pinicola TaxID=2219663 RepID=A0A2X0IS47_9ACTN|nr:serine hydrolase domain-containing protein [Streptacidiphilus pinicola]RAG86443.1 penicillin-binding protein [Streptacidiphilus pinicola]